MNRSILFGVALLALGVIAIGGAIGASAQVIDPIAFDPELCTDERYDFDGDGRLTKKDIEIWDRTFAQCRTGGTCPDEMDIDGNGRVDLDDLDHFYLVFHTCMYPPVRPVDIPGPWPPPTPEPPIRP